MNGTLDNIKLLEGALLVIAAYDPSTGEPRMSAGEELIKGRLEQLGFEVIVKAAAKVETSDASGMLRTGGEAGAGDHPAKAETSHASGMSVIVICSGSSAQAVNTKFHDVAVPVVVLNHELFQIMRMARKPKKESRQTAVRILDRAHPMAAGLENDVTVCAAATMFWAKPHKDALKVASSASDGSKYVWFAYERDAEMIGKRAKTGKSRGDHRRDENDTPARSDCDPIAQAPAAPARRVGLFFSEDVALHATPQGWSLFSAAVCWAAGREALLVVGSIDPMSQGDKNIEHKLQGLGYAVTVKEDKEASNADAKRKSVIVLSSTVSTDRVKTRFRHAERPAIVLKGDLFADMGMTGATNGDFGEVAGQTQVEIVKGGHPMAAGSSGRVSVCETGQYVSWGNPASSATRIATQVGDHSRTLIFGYKAGSEMVRLEAPARRVGLFFSDGVAESCTDEGWKLFAAAVAWAVDSREKEVLFVVGSTSSSWGKLSAGDIEIKNRIESLCYSVTLRDWADGERSDVDGKSLVVISSTVDADVTAGQNSYNFADAIAPVLCMSADVFPLLGMTGDLHGTDYGKESATQIEITDPHHSMAAGSNGMAELSAVDAPMAWGDTSSRKAKKVIRVASHLGDQTRAALFGYEADAQMPGLRSPARRVGFCFSDAVAVDATDEAWRLFDAAVNWSAGLGVMEFRDIFIEEWQEVLERRAKFYEKRASRARCNAPENLVGLALSGGGIRSATFCLGFLQGLHDAGLLRIFDYLSTVSGGGYLGGWWSAWLSREEREERERIFPEAEAIEPARTASYIGRDAKDKIAEGSMCAGKDPIHHLRLFANYLTPRKGALSADTWRATAVVSRNLIMTWLIMVPVIIGFVLLGQLYFVLQENSLSDFLFPFWQEYGQVLNQLNQRKGYASDFAEISLDKEKQDKFEQTVEYVAAKTGSDYKEMVALLRRKLAADPSEQFSEDEKNKLKSLSEFLSGKARSSEKPREFDDLARFITVQSADGYKGMVQQLDEDGFRYISKYLPPKPEYEERKKEIGTLIEYFRSEPQAPVIISAETVGLDPVEKVKEWLRSLSKPVIADSLKSDTEPKVEELANSLSAISQKRIIDLRKELTTESLDQEQPKVAERVMEEATGPLRQKHQRDLRDRMNRIILTLLPIAGWIVLMIVLWMRTGMPALSWAYASHSLGGLAAFAILLCTVLLFMFPVSDIFASLKALGALGWQRQYLLKIGIWGCVAGGLWLYVRPWSIRPPSNADRFGVEEWRKEVRRNKIERVHSTLLVFLVITGAVLVISGFGHEIVDYVWADPQPKKWLVDYVAKAGGWVAVITAIGGSIYTAVKASPSGGADNRQSGKETLTNRFMFAITPPLVVVVLAVVAAWVAHWLLGHTVNENILASDLGEAVHRFPPLTMAIVVGVALCLYFAVYEMERRKGWVAVFAFIAVCVIEVIGGLTYFSNFKKWGLNWELRLVLVFFVLAVGGLIFFRLMVDEVDGLDSTRRPRVFERFQLRVFRDLFKSKKKSLWLLAVFSVLLPILALLPANRLLPNATGPREPLSGLSIGWLVGIIMCLTFFAFEILAGKGDNRRSLWLAAVMYAALCALFVFSFYTIYAQHSSIMLGHAALGLLAMTFTWVVALGWMADPNRLSLHTFYRARLVRAYMGASNPIRRDQLNEITESVAGDDVLLHHLRNCRNGAPYHIMNTTLSLVGGRDLSTAQRSAAVFAMSKRYCGSSRTGYRKSEDYMSGRVTLGTAVAVSGAAVSPTMGAKNPTAALAMLMTLLNIRLGYWAPTPNKEAWQADQARLWPFYILHEFMSQTNDVATYCYLTDGGHFDNTGLYSLVERGCRYIVVVDNGQDPQPCFQDLGDAIRRCRIDFGAEIDLNVTPLFKTKVEDEEKQYAEQHFVVGTITYSLDHVRRLKWAGDIENNNRRRGIIILIKPSLARDETVDLRQYGLENDNFPQHKTSDQWFDEAQFESYRALGQLSARRVFGDFTRSPKELTLYEVEQIFEGVLRARKQQEKAEPAVAGVNPGKAGKQEI